MGGKPFNQYLHPFLQVMMKVIIVKKVVITVADKRITHVNYSLLEPYMYLSIHKAQPFTLNVNRFLQVLRFSLNFDTLHFASNWNNKIFIKHNFYYIR